MDDDEDTQHQGSSGRKRKEASSDEELETLEEGQESACLSWRSDPNATYSDWTIEIHGKAQASDNSSTKIYHVHRNILSCGPNRSEYFERVFQNENLAEWKTKTSRIELDKIAADAFPVFLDYLYVLSSDDFSLAMTNRNATALHHLAKYFGVARLRKRVLQFCRNNLEHTNWHVYYEHSKIFHDDEIRHLVLKNCSRELQDISPNGSLMKVSDSNLWIDVLQLLKEQKSTTEHVAILIATFCAERTDQLDADTFLKLTDGDLLPSISWRAALSLLESERKILAEGDTSTLSSLQERCIEGMVSSWDRLDTSILQKSLERLSPLVLATVFIRTTKQAQTMVESVIPVGVVISGESFKSVHGTYCRAKKAPYFVMKGQWSGNKANFVIELNNDGDEWNLSVYLDGESIGTIIFSVKRMKGDPMLPPRDGWESSIKLAYLFDVDGGQEEGEGADFLDD